MDGNSIWQRELFRWPTWACKWVLTSIALFAVALATHSEIQVLTHLDNYALVTKHSAISGWFVFALTQIAYVTCFWSSFRMLKASDGTRLQILLCAMAISGGVSARFVPTKFDRPDVETYFLTFPGLYGASVFLFLAALIGVIFETWFFKPSHTDCDQSGSSLI
jgi:hypothetical protein